MLHDLNNKSEIPIVLSYAALFQHKQCDGAYLIRYGGFWLHFCGKAFPLPLHGHHNKDGQKPDRPENRISPVEIKMLHKGMQNHFSSKKWKTQERNKNSINYMPKFHLSKITKHYITYNKQKNNYCKGNLIN